MINNPTFKVTLGSLDTEHNVKCQFDTYEDNGRTALMLIIQDGEDAGQMLAATVNIPDAYIPNGAMAAIKDYDYNAGMVDSLINAGIIEAEPVTFAQSGFIIAPVHYFTEDAIALRDKQFNEHILSGK